MNKFKNEAQELEFLRHFYTMVSTGVICGLKTPAEWVLNYDRAYNDLVSPEAEQKIHEFCSIDGMCVRELFMMVNVRAPNNRSEIETWLMDDDSRVFYAKFFELIGEIKKWCQSHKGWKVTRENDDYVVHRKCGGPITIRAFCDKAKVLIYCSGKGMNLLLDNDKWSIYAETIPWPRKWNKKSFFEMIDCMDDKQR